MINVRIFDGYLLLKHLLCAHYVLCTMQNVDPKSMDNIFVPALKELPI